MSNHTHVIGNFIEQSLQAKREEYVSKLEPFDVYVAKQKRILMEIHGQCVERITHGYQVILEEIESEIEKK